MSHAEAFKDFSHRYLFKLILQRPFEFLKAHKMKRQQKHIILLMIMGPTNVIILAQCLLQFLTEKKSFLYAKNDSFRKRKIFFMPKVK